MGFSKSKGPTKKQLEPFGGKKAKAPSFNVPGDRNFGLGPYSETQATAASKGMSLPAMPKMKGKGPARKDAKKAFGKVPGKAVF